jgi:hypothetical protein
VREHRAWRIGHGVKDKSFDCSLLSALCAMLLCASCVSYPFAGWDRTNTALQATATAAQAADWSQTRWIASHRNGGWTEMNSLIGRRPTDSEVNAYFLASSIARLALSASLKEPWRKWSQYVFIATSTALIGYNIHAGVGWKW